MELFTCFPVCTASTHIQTQTCHLHMFSCLYGINSYPDANLFAHVFLSVRHQLIQTQTCHLHRLVEWRAVMCEKCLQRRTLLSCFRLHWTHCTAFNLHRGAGIQLQFSMHCFTFWFHSCWQQLITTAVHFKSINCATRRVMSLWKIVQRK
jgi:hypothetical protein